MISRGLAPIVWALTCLTGISCTRDEGDGPAAAARAVSSCERLALTPADFTGILKAPITNTKPIAGDAQSCGFLTASFPAITVSVRPGVGRASLEAWTSGKMPLMVSQLAGVGDAAEWQATLHEVIAQKDDVLCDIQVLGGAGDIASSAAALPAVLGALCNKIFEGQ